MKRNILLAVVFAALLVPFLEDTADAGVLLRSQRVSSRVRVRPARIRLGRARSSTALYSRLNPIRSEGYNEPSVEYKRLIRERKYQQKLYQWRLKQAKLQQREQIRAKRKLDQQRKKAAKAAKKRQQTLARLQREGGGSESDAVESSLEEGAKKPGQDKLEIGATERATKGQKIEGDKTRKKAPFWTRFWRALFPRANK